MELVKATRFLTKQELRDRNMHEFALIVVSGYIPLPEPPYGCEWFHWDGTQFIDLGDKETP